MCCASSFLRLSVLVLFASFIVGCDSSPNRPAATPGPGAPPPPPPPPGASAAAQSGAVPAWAGERQDEPFDVRQFLISREAPADNAAPLYLTALAPISSDLGGESSRALQTEIGELASVDKLSAGMIPAHQVAAVVAKAERAIQQIDAAQTKSQCVFITGLSADAQLSHVQAARSLVRLSVLQLQHSRNIADLAMAEAAVKRSLRMSRDLQPRGHVVCQLVSISMDGSICSAIERLTLNDPRLTVEHCDRLLSLLAEHQANLLDRLDEGLKMEYVMSRNSIHDLQTGRLTLAQLAEFLGGASATSIPHGPAPNYDEEIATCNRLFKMLIDGTRQQGSAENALSAVRQELDRIKTERPLCMLLVPPAEPFADATVRIQTNFAGLQSLIALRRYELVHGILPPSLEAAASETTLKSVPIDPYAQAPMRYAVLAGKPTVYSLGKDRKDDGGQMDWNNGKKPGDYLFALTPKTAAPR